MDSEYDADEYGYDDSEYADDYGYETESDTDSEYDYDEYGYDESEYEGYDDSDEYGYETESDMDSEYDEYEYDYSDEYGYETESNMDSEYDYDEYDYDNSGQYGYDSSDYSEEYSDGEYEEYGEYDEYNEYDEYEYATPEESYAEEYDDRAEPAEEATECFDESEETSSWEAEESAWDYNSLDTCQSGLELFSWCPIDLLDADDLDVLRELARLQEEPAGVRRAVLNDYLEGLPYEAIELASRFQDVTGIEALGLADDPAGAAALLAAFRLLDNGELGLDESVDLLERSLENLPEQWISGISDLTRDALETPDWQEMAPTTPVSDESSWDTWDMGTTWIHGPVLGPIVRVAPRVMNDLRNAATSLAQGFIRVDGLIYDAQTLGQHVATRITPWWTWSIR